MKCRPFFSSRDVRNDARSILALEVKDEVLIRQIRTRQPENGRLGVSASDVQSALQVRYIRESAIQRQHGEEILLPGGAEAVFLPVLQLRPMLYLRFRQAPLLKATLDLQQDFDQQLPPMSSLTPFLCSTLLLQAKCIVTFKAEMIFKARNKTKLQKSLHYTYNTIVLGL